MLLQPIQQAGLAGQTHQRHNAVFVFHQNGAKGISQKLQRNFGSTGLGYYFGLAEPQAYIQRIYLIANTEFFQIVVALVKRSHPFHDFTLSVVGIFNNRQLPNMLQQQFLYFFRNS